ncbi:kinesin-like protein KIFC3 isoform X2 [Crassostrea angulata]|nr:kinesin-like protein KIFC3 isoform X2 [Crassostrea angulata]XP_052714449.1 kinesin-like protein KIFC3 isoform X2 [Crassostrea angulata]XP_052714450.1 kinesin-like protein KIFC3 isoform X2 [Crassostrea angulata]XP_052714451.1 kinesin-like protein KIFC3 isoform X2 [Crassostrea angulata]XP_052714452.1 kinesin-like protein KIFC3 isoform X2 [Crassostrea angulata]XP_052714453.1 kinesin-like protein KIFC3 isoform X2 [Crassostrea angulata]XP_052714454.1 kinesin-like protein KIFC3 isoform X2 [Crass
MNSKVLLPGTPTSKIKEPAFRTPMSYSPRIVGNKPVPSPSRSELWKKQLGFEDDIPVDSPVESEDENSLDESDDKENISIVEYKTLQKQLDERNSERDELLFTIRNLSEKNKKYKQKLEKEEMTKRQQMRILCKTQEINLMEKDKLIGNLQSLVEEQEGRLVEAETATNSNGSQKLQGNANSAAYNKMVEDIKRLHEEKVSLTKQLELVQSEMENHSCMNGVSDDSNQEIITRLEKEKKELQEELNKYNKNSVQPSDTGPCHTDTEKQVEKLLSHNKELDEEVQELRQSQARSTSLFEEGVKKQKDLEEELKIYREKLTKLQESLQKKTEEQKEGELKHRDQVSKLQEEHRVTSRRMRDLMVEVTHLQAREPEVVTKIKVQEVQVESQETLDSLRVCEREREEYRAQLEDSQSQHYQLSALLEQEQGLNEQLSDQVNKQKERLISLAQETAEKLEEAERAKEAAIQNTKKQMERNLKHLEARYKQLCEQASLVLPAYQELFKSYTQLQAQCRQFPQALQTAITGINNQICQAIRNIGDYNKDLVRRYHKEMQLRKKYHNELVELKGNIRVFCRVRPKIKEDGGGVMGNIVVDYDRDDNGLIYVNNKGRSQTFEMDLVFTPESTQQQVFDEVQSLVTSCVDGFNVCIFAYGQTGSGKTFTMEGNKDNPGINQRALAMLFKETEDRGQDWTYTITVSVMEIYNEMIRDLLSGDPSYKMEVKMKSDGGLHVPGLCSEEVKSVEDVNQVFALGQKNRATATTNMNEHSSRSHALLTVQVLGVNKTTNVRTMGKLNLVDLAGSERVSKSGADGTRLKEAQNINKSLSCLGDVIHALRSKQSHVPYRNSKLTYLLQDSLGGDSKTLMIVQIAPVEKNLGESVCSLNFAQRVRTVELGQASRQVVQTGDETNGVSPSTPNKAPSTPTRSVSMNTPTGRQHTPIIMNRTPGSSNKGSSLRYPRRPDK